MRQVRDILALVMLAICAYTDIKERNIYIAPLLITASGGLIITAVSKENVFNVLLSAVMWIAASRFMKRFAGQGDAYVAAALSAVIGVYESLQTIMAGLFLAALFALYMLAAKKKTLRSSMAFAPFIMGGFILVLLHGS